MLTVIRRGSLVLLAVVVLLWGATAFAGTTERVSVDSSGLQGNDGSHYSCISADGRYVAFESYATNLVPGDIPWRRIQIFVHDRQTGATERVSVSSSGGPADNSSLDPSISADGRYVAFTSGASNLVPDDTNGKQDIFVYDRQTGAMELVSVDSSGLQANNYSTYLSMNADGRYVAFQSSAWNLVPVDTNGQTADIFVHDRQTGTTELVSVDSNGVQCNGDSQRPSISADGRYVAFQSDVSNLVPGDTNGYEDVFVHDRQTGTTERVSVDSSGLQGNFYSIIPSISADGRYVAFYSAASNLVPDDTNGGAADIFVHDRQTGATELVSVDSSGLQGNNYSEEPSISSDGRYVAFWSAASNLVLDDTNGIPDVFVHDRQTGATELVSVDSSGLQGNNGSYIPFISADGRYVAFTSDASNLVPDDTNGIYDVFVHDRYDNDGDGYAYYEDCDDYDPFIYPGAPEVKHDGIDQDCNGYDLTIDITKADYTAAKKSSPDSLVVWATSDLGASAGLTVSHGSVVDAPMTWSTNKWVYSAESVGGDPGTVTVSGVEGSETAPTQ